VEYEVIQANSVIELERLVNDKLSTMSVPAWEPIGGVTVGYRLEKSTMALAPDYWLEPTYLQAVIRRY